MKGIWDNSRSKSVYCRFIFFLFSCSFLHSDLLHSDFISHQISILLEIHLIFRIFVLLQSHLELELFL